MHEEYSAADLDEMDVSEQEFFIEGLLPEGLSFIAGPPKFGKTYLNLMLGVSVASGEPFLGRAVKRPCKVLYLYLEGDAAQVKRRLHDIYGDRPLPRDLIFVHSLPPMSAGGSIALARLIRKHKPELVIIDTWQLVRGDDVSGKMQTAYMREYAELNTLKGKLCGKLGVSVLLTHHTKQIGGREKAFDDLSKLNGSTALSGCADAVLLLSGARGSDRVTLTAHGRSFEDVEIVLKKTKPMGWEPAEAKPSENWTEIQTELARILNDFPQGVTASEAARLISKTEDSVRRQLNRWAQLGKIEKDGKTFRNLMNKTTNKTTP